MKNRALLTAIIAIAICVIRHVAMRYRAVILSEAALSQMDGGNAQAYAVADSLHLLSSVALWAGAAIIGFMWAQYLARSRSAFAITPEKAEEILRERYGYTDEDVDRVRGREEEEEEEEENK